MLDRDEAKMSIENQSNRLAEWLAQTIKDFVNQSPENSIKNMQNDRAWGDPLVGFSRSDDPLYEEYKKQIGPFYWTPLEIFNHSFPGLSAKANQLTVVSWILPQTEATKSEHRKQLDQPGERWVRSYVYGERFNNQLREHLEIVCRQAGLAAVAPVLSKLWERKTSSRYGFASTWSERHAAYAAGLGTFGLCDGLITAKGKAVRCGSVVVNARIPVSRRPYEDHHEYCLFFSKRSCGKCVNRCPAGAISPDGHDKIKCKDYTRGTVLPFTKSLYGLEAHPCGLCQTKVPCESKIPLSDKD